MQRRCKDRIRGGLASGHCPSEFDQEQLAKGIEVELEHTVSRLVAREIAMDHLTEDPDYYRKLKIMEETGCGYRPNRRVRTVDAAELAADMRRRFTDREVEEMREYPFDWPEVFQHVGESLAVAYSSDKWKQQRGDMTAYKHLAESPNAALLVPGMLKGVRVVGPMIDVSSVPLPTHFAILGLFEELDLRLHVGGTDAAPLLGDGDDGCVQVVVRHGYLAGSYIRWSATRERQDQPFLFIYTHRDGILGIVLGEKLDVHKDGIIG